MMNMKFLLYCAVAALGLSSCNFDKKSFKSTGIAVTGKIGEILVVCDQDIWDSRFKECLDTNLTQFIMPYFPDVATFELIHKTPSHFTQGVKRYRNTMFINIDPALKGDIGKIEKRVGVWAADQLVIDITARDFEQLEKICSAGLKSVHQEFDTYEWKRIKKYYAESENRYITDKVIENFGIDFELPDGARLVTTRANFYRIEFPSAARPIEFVGAGTQDPGTITSGILVYQYDYKDSSQFSLEKLLRDRDTMLRYNVPSDYEGMYMGTQYNKIVYPEIDPTTNEDGTLSVVEMKGMFVFVGLGKHGTGGAFWAYHFIHSKSQKMICVSGYVDAPSTASWTQPLREVQAILKSVVIK